MKDTDLITMQRIQSSLCSDKRFKAENMSKVLKSEIINVLENYLVLDKESVNVSLKMNEYGFIELDLKALAKRSKIVGVLPDENSFI